jgi:hypothetical protein
MLYTTFDSPVDGGNGNYAERLMDKIEQKKQLRSTTNGQNTSRSRATTSHTRPTTTSAQATTSTSTSTSGMCSPCSHPS